MDYKTKLYNYIQDHISEDIDNSDNDLDKLIQKESHEPILLFTKINSLIKETNKEIAQYINGIKYLKVHGTMEWEIIDGKRSNMLVRNIDRDSWTLQHHINLHLEKAIPKSWNTLTNEIWVKDTIRLNTNIYAIFNLESLYEDLKLKHPKSHKIYTKNLSKHLIKHTSDNILIEKFEWTTNISNLGFLFNLLKQLGYINYPKDSNELAADNLLTMFKEDESLKHSLQEYLSVSSRDKIKDKIDTFVNACKKEDREEGNDLFRLPHRKYLRSGKN